MPSPSGPVPPDATADDGVRPADDTVESARGFALTEDWLATIVGLAIVVLALLGVLTESWLPL